jgi:ParB family chromosome partitioning protein
MIQEIRHIDPLMIDASPYQPRRRFDEERLEELAASIRQHGIIQPVVVRMAGQRFELVAGERRLRAAQRLGLAQVPAVVRSLSDEQALEAALIENLQREDISVVEAARAFQRLAEEFLYSHAEIAQRTGKSRVAVTNTLRLLNLPEPVLESLDRGDITEGHALALPYPSLQAELAEWIARNAITVREAERKVRSLVADERNGSSPAGKPQPAADLHTADLEDRLRKHFGTKAAVTYRGGRGTLALEFYSDDDLCRILELLGVPCEGL